MSDVQAALAELDDKYERLHTYADEVGVYGPGGMDVLETAYHALKEKKTKGEVPLVGLEDLWAHSLQEGIGLFSKPERLWGRTTAEDTGDMIGQTTIGPWQMTITNVRKNYGPRYGIDPAWSDAEIYEWSARRPIVQAKMIADFIQESYEKFGVRSPYAIQRYFWLDPFVRGEIGQGHWTNSPVAKAPEGQSWHDLTPELKRQTGFYAKQVLLGTRYNPRGLLFWVYVADGEEAAREVLQTWRDQPRLVRVEGKGYVATDEVGGFTVRPEDVIYGEEHPEIRAALKEIVADVAAGN